MIISKSNETATVDIEQEGFLSAESIPELEIIFKRLHHFRRGTILGSNSQSSDDRALLRDLFLRMPLHDCLLMMVPDLELYYFDNNSEVVSTHAPAETLVTLDDNVSFVIHLMCLLYGRKNNPIIKCKLSVLLQQTTLIVCLYGQALELKILLMRLSGIIVEIAYRNLQRIAFLHP